MAQRIGPQPSFLNDLFSRIGSGLNTYGAQQQQQREAEAASQQAAQTQQLFQSLGLPPETINQPEWVQKKLLTETLRPESMAEFFGSYMGMGKNARIQNLLQQPQAGTYQIGEETVQLDPQNISPQLQQKLQQFGVQPQQQSSSVGQVLSSGGLGALSQVLGIPGDLGSVATQLLDFATPTAAKMTPEQAQKRQEQLKQKLSQVEPGSPQAQEIENAIQATESLTKGLQPVHDILPTTENISSAVKKASKGTIFEPYMVPQSDTQKWAETVGNYVGLLANPTKAARQGAIAVLKDLAKATGVALGGDAAGWFTQKATGSEIAGDLMRNGIYIMYNLFPGSFNKNVERSYQKFDKNVMQKAAKNNIQVATPKYRSGFDKIRTQFDKQFDVGAEGRNKLFPFMQRTEELIESNAKVDPNTIQSLKKEFGRALSKLPDEAKSVGNKLYNFQKDILYDFANKVTPNGAETLKSADALYRASLEAQSVMENMKNTVLPRNLGLGTMLYLAGGYKPALAFGIGGTGISYLAKMMKSPAIRSTMTQLAKAGAAQNAQLINKLAQKLNKQASKIDPEQAQLLYRLMSQEQINQ